MSVKDITSNERTFQGILLNTINSILTNTDNILFDKILQEQNVGVDSARFGDGLLYSKKDTSKIVLFELKDSSWDATDERLVYDAMMKAFNRGFEYFVTGTPRQLVIYKTFEPDTTPNERKLKIYDISNIRNIQLITSSLFISQINTQLKLFLQDLSDIVHNIREVQWDSIDKFFVKKLSAYILEGSADMTEIMYSKIKGDIKFKKDLKKYLQGQDIFNIHLTFDGEEVYQICQLANYLLYLKIIFYSYLQRDVPTLKLKPLEIPEDRHKLNKILRERFDDVLKHDFELIFKKNILDDFEYNEKYLPVLKRNVEQIQILEFKDLNVDIIGTIYNSLLDNQEQHHRGQHFTNVNEVDIVNTFCIDENTNIILDSGCGAGTFLVRAYHFIKTFHPNLKHEEYLERLWGIEIALFPAFLATMNLSLLNIKTMDNYPVIIQNDFSKIKNTSSAKLIFQNMSKLFNVTDIGGKNKKVSIPVFDACIGNPPYVRQENIENKERWINLALSENDIKKINQQSDLYVYYLMHTAAFLKDGGKLGYVISSSWLDVSYGGGFQKYLLDNFKIIAIIENQKVRSFETASINTVILILEKCKSQKNRERNKVKFVRIFKDYDEIIGNSTDKNRIENLKKFIYRINKTNKLTKDKTLLITVRQQNELEKESTFKSKYTNGNWGAKYLRSPEIYNKIIETAGDKLISLSKICDIKYGIKTGANDFFYVKDETYKVEKLTDEEFKLSFGHERKNSRINWDVNGWFYSALTKRHHLLERRYFKPLFKTQKEASKLDVDLKKLKYQVLVCSESKITLRKYKIKLLKYIEDAESPKYKINERPTCKSRISADGTRNWFNLGDDIFIGDFIFPSKVGEYYRLIDNRSTKIFCDKVNYNIKVKNEFKEYSDIIFLILNSTLFRFFFDLFSRQLTGSQTLSDVDVNVIENTFIINPLLLESNKTEIKEILNSFKNREQFSIFDEVKKDDRNKLDLLIFKKIGLSKKDLDKLYKEEIQYIEERKIKSRSVNNVKVKQTLNYETSLNLVQDRFDDIKNYNELLRNTETTLFSIPNLEPQFPKDISSGDSNLFEHYKIKFKDGKKEIVVNFENNSQILLYKFLYKNFDVKNTKLKLPKSAEKCNKVLIILEYDFEKYSPQIKAMLKTHRSKAHYLSIYKDLIMM